MKKLLFVLFLVIGAGCVQQQEVAQMGEMQLGSIQLTSPAFTDGSRIPDKYTCSGDDVSPALNIEKIPEGAQSLALIVDDPDAPIGIWDHWIIWNIKPTELLEEGAVPVGAVQGTNSFGKLDYGGPCPPPGPTHRYFFKLYALDTMLELEEGTRKEDVERAIAGHVLAQTQLMGTYSR